MLFGIDFETYYDQDYSLTKGAGVDGYVNDPRFDPYLVSVYGEDFKFVGHPSEFDWSILDGQDLVAHNARFDETVLLRMKELGLVPKNFFFRRTDCTADLVSYMHYPRSLKDASRELLGVTLKKEVRETLKGMNSVNFFSVTPERKAEMLEYAGADAESCYKLWTQYSSRWPESERRLSRLNREQGRRGVQIDMEYLNNNIETLHEALWEAEKDIPWDWDDNKTPLSHKELRLACRKENILAPASLSADSLECAEWEDTYGDRYPWVGAMRNWRRANILVKRLTTIQNRVNGDGIFPFSLLYFGSHTGRYSGADGYNMQNMLGQSRFGINLRQHFKARDGHKLMIVDLAQIEARILLWLAGDNKMLDRIREGHSVYEAHAIETMGWDGGVLKDENKEKYALAKARVLGLGFGCGATRFRDLARTMAKLDLSEDESKRIVQDYRDTNPRITWLWRELNSSCIKSVEEDLDLELPSGRSLHYFDIESRPNLSGEVVKGRRRVSLFGGKLAENVTQAVARDVFTDGILRLHEAGIRILWHVHDEYILEVPSDFSDTREILKLVSVTPDWLPGCPVEAEATYSNYYAKN